ncbi:MAG: carbohydrate ABC transporter permease [Deinococcales bacterium]
MTRLSRFAGTLGNYLLLIAFAAFFLFPVVIMIVSSLKPDDQLIIRDLASPMAFVPSVVSLKNYRDVFANLPFGVAMRNSLIIVGTIVGVGLFVNSMAAYALARLRFRGRALIVGVVVALMIIPFESISVPLLLMVNRFGWLDTLYVQIIPFVADAFSIFLFYQFFINLPRDIEEAAVVDGASRWRIYWSILLPLSRPVMATASILLFLRYWGQLLWPVMVARSTEVRPLPLAMQQFFGQQPREWGQIMAFAAMITVPVLIVYLIFNRWFVQSIASSGVKG